LIKNLTLLLFLLLANKSFSQQINDSNNIKIYGKVIDATSNKPLEYATIVLKNSITNKLSGGITGIDGKFNVEAPKGTYEISIEFISLNLKNSQSKPLPKI